MREQLRFFRTFVRHPFSVGAIAPSSRYLASRMVRDMGIESADTVVELGPGTGAFTAAILDCKRPDTEYLAIELDPGFAASLRERHPGIHVINGSAADLPEHLEQVGKSQTECILCGLPWASFPEELQRSIMNAVVDSLPPGGQFATFAYIHASWFPTARKFRRFLEAHFARVETTRVEWLNLPPAFVYRCTR